MLSTHSNIFALVDCNNFYASCERLFDPSLNHKPVIILSSNDGCVIARSNEAKMLGIQMSQPYFQIERLCEKNKVRVLSSNFALYGDISHRVMMVLRSFCLDTEIYSIDEAFLRLDKIAFSDATAYAIKIKEALLKQVGIPVSIGIARTKTLAKAASILAKQHHRFSKDHICNLQNEAIKDQALRELKVGEIWGVGKQSAWQLEMMKINTAFDLSIANTSWLKKQFSIMMKRISMELQGTSCLTSEEIHQKKNITCSRSFEKSITTFADLSQAVSHYVARACEKARTEKTKAHSIIVFIRTRLFNKENFYSRSESIQLVHPSNDSIYITQTATQLLKKIYRPNFSYKKAGIILCDLIPEYAMQADLFHDNQDNHDAIMTILDRINHRFGTHHLFLGAEGINPTWRVKSTKKTPAYTTNWKEIKKVVANNVAYCFSKTLKKT